MKRWLPALAVFAPGLFSGATLLAIAGVSLNFFLASAAFAAILTPLLAQHFIQLRWRRILLFILALSMCGWVAIGHGSISIAQWLAVTAVIVAIAAAETGAVELLESLGVPTVPASTLVLLAMIGWASWPVWGSLHLGDGGAPHVVPLHPLFAINGVLPALGIWTEQPMPYRLTAFGQNVVYRLPTSVLPCVALHAAIAVLFGLIVKVLRLKHPRRLQ